MMNEMNIKELLKEAFEAGEDRNHYIFQEMAGTPDDKYAPSFEEWYNTKFKNNVVGRSEQFYCYADEYKSKNRCQDQCLGCAGLEEMNLQ